MSHHPADVAYLGITIPRFGIALRDAPSELLAVRLQQYEGKLYFTKSKAVQRACRLWAADIRKELARRAIDAGPVALVHG